MAESGFLGSAARRGNERVRETGMNILKTAKIWFSLSLLAILDSLFSVFFFGYRLGVDFAGGALLEVKVANEGREDASELIARSYRERVNLEVAVQGSGENRFLVRSREITNEQKEAILNDLRSALGEVEELRFETVSPLISRDVVRKAILAVIVAVLGILFYISLSFRRVPQPATSFRFAVAAILALVHDAIILLGAYALASFFFGAEVDSLFITSLLTLLGFSVHDTIVTFDRIRENLRRRKEGESFEELANRSVNETIIRSINTSYTLILVLLAVFLFGGATLKWMAFALLVGVFIGTYSTIFIATPILVWWQKRVERARLKVEGLGKESF